MAPVNDHAKAAARSHRHRREHHDRAVESALRDRPGEDDTSARRTPAGPDPYTMIGPYASHDAGAQSH